VADQVSGNPGNEPTVQPTAGPDGNVSSPIQALMAMAVGGEDIWTLDQMEQAEPCDIIEVDEDQLAAELDELAPVRAADGGQVVEGGEPVDEELDTEPLSTSGGYNYPPPFTRFEVPATYTAVPYRSIGKLFFKRGSSSYVCSAASIGGDAIWTAGHCLHAGNNRSDGWATNVVFVPGYRDGAAPFGQWQAKQLWVRTTWYQSGNPRGLCQDMGGAILYPRNRRRISEAVGWLGFAWNWGKYQHWNQFGYPAAAPFDGQRLITSQSSFAYDGSVGCNPAPVGVGSDLTGGSSGGPWVLNLRTNSYLNGNNSYRRGSKPLEMFSPVFNNNAKSLFDVLRKAKA